jgi:hypothetical protein
MENWINSAFLLTLGGIIGFLVDKGLNLLSLKNVQDNFYAEPFLKVKSERIIGLSDCLCLLKYELTKPSPNVDKLNKLIFEFENLTALLNASLNQENIKILADLDNELKECASNSDRTLDKFNNLFDQSLDMLRKFSPKDHLFRRNKLFKI